MGIRVKFGTCSVCNGDDKPLKRVKPPQCQKCYDRLKREEYFERQKAKPKEQNKIEHFSSNNTYTTSYGERVTKKEIEDRIRNAKAQKLKQMIDRHGYIFCEDCGRNDCKPVDCSHDISVKECQETGKVELAWSVENITMRGRKCHNIHDGNGIS